MRNTTLKKIGKPLLQIGLPVAIAAFFLYKVKDYNWQILTADAARWNYWLLAVCFLGFILQADLAIGPQTPGLSPRFACLPAYLPGLRVCALYSWERLARPDACFVDGKIWRAASYRLCQYDSRTDYKAGGRCHCFCPESLILGECQCT